ncbi:hypothetical protein RRG08_034134 [Elysia crispata]|uniref:Uncharacterized protein n=1 Tax=Elysia crispata TaxID=231223 RepID=A0AAE1DIY4_9GAST|nr:hypothetical protein RRG08_034134 [Elysia crispata]
MHIRLNLFYFEIVYPLNKAIGTYTDDFEYPFFVILNKLLSVHPITEFKVDKLIIVHLWLPVINIDCYAASVDGASGVVPHDLHHPITIQQRIQHVSPTASRPNVHCPRATIKWPIITFTVSGAGGRALEGREAGPV